MNAPEVVVVPDAAAAATRAADAIADALREAVADRGRADWATTGGSTPVGIYQAMLTPRLRDTIPWEAIHTWWGDDRFVPGDHPLSNVRAVRRRPAGGRQLGERPFGRAPDQGQDPRRQSPSVPDR